MPSGDVTAISITHPHFYHFADMNIILSHCKANVYVCQRGIELAKKRGFDLTRFRRIKANDSLIIGDLRIKAYQSEHCKIDAKVIGKILLRQFSYQRIKTTLKIKKQNSFYSIDKKTDIFGYEILDEDKSVFIFGSANFSESVTYPTNMDLLVFPYQGRSDMVSYSMKFIDKFQPRSVLLDHFDDSFPPISSQMDTQEFIQCVQKKYPKIHIFEPEELVEYIVE